MPVTLSALRAVFVLSVSLGLSSLLFGSQAGLIGHWNGTMVREGARLEVSFDFIPSGTQPRGHVHFLDSASHGLSARFGHGQRRYGSLCPR